MIFCYVFAVSWYQLHTLKPKSMVIVEKYLDKSRPSQQEENSQKSKQEEKNQESRISQFSDCVSGTS